MIRYLLSFFVGRAFPSSANATTTATPPNHGTESHLPIFCCCLSPPWGGKLLAPLLPSLIEMAVCSCVRRTGEKGIKSLQTREEMGDKKSTVFQPKANSRCWVAAIDKKRLVMPKKVVSGTTRAYEANIACSIHGEGEPKECLNVTVGYASKYTE